MPRRQLTSPAKPHVIDPVDHAVPIELGHPDHTIKPTVTLFPNSFTSLTACNYLKYRALQGKHKIGLPSTPSDQHTLDRLYKRINHDLTTAIQSTQLKRAETPDGFFVVDMENGAVNATSNEISTISNKMSLFQHIETTIIRFPIYLVFIFFLFLYDILIDGKFRRHVRDTIQFSCSLESE